jgi:hypothetical protein
VKLEAACDRNLAEAEMRLLGIIDFGKKKGVSSAVQKQVEETYEVLRNAIGLLPMTSSFLVPALRKKLRLSQLSQNIRTWAGFPHRKSYGSRIRRKPCAGEWRVSSNSSNRMEETGCRFARSP